MELHVLPERTADAAGNMALDFLMFQRYTPADAVRFRHYSWRRPAFTFGYGQPITFVRAQLPKGERLDITRRATGGGVVDHRRDWTYALVLPRKHPLFDRPGPTIYRTVHQALAHSLDALGARVRLQLTQPEMEAGICFERPEVGDIVRPDNGAKVAGAALKRGKYAILLQGSIWKPALPEITDWALLMQTLPAQLGATLETTIAYPGWPAFNPEEEEALIEQYSAPTWIERR